MQMFTTKSRPAVPARVQAALDYLDYCRWVTEQSDPSIPRRELSPLEVSVATAALRVLGAYFHGEMDFGDVPPRRDEGDGGDGEAGGAVPSPTPTR
jgi:hypothetical protein